MLFLPCLSSGLRDLHHLSLGWCRNLGAVACDPSNNIQALACLTRLTHLNLGGTQVCDAQLRLVLPHLKFLQVREGFVQTRQLLLGPPLDREVVVCDSLCCLDRTDLFLPLS